MSTLFPEVPIDDSCYASSLRPRDYQREAIENCVKLWDAGTVGSLIRVPTGCGKTLTAAWAMDEWCQRSQDHYALVLCHERQLVQQFRQELEDVLGIHIGLEMSNDGTVTFGSHNTPQFIVASRQSLQKKTKKCRRCTDGCDECTNGLVETSRLFKFDWRKNWLLVIDELHRYSRSMKSCRHIFQWFEQNSAHRRLGLTATPERSDKKSLFTLTPGVAIDYPMYDIGGERNALDDGWVVPFDQRFIQVEGLDWKNIKEVAGDFRDDDLERVLEEEETIRSMIQPMLDLVEDRQTLIFSPTVAMAKNVASRINAMGKDAEWLSGEVQDELRQDVYSKFERGDIQFLSVCGLCIARGAIILTDKGEVPIQNVTKDMKVWDGVEFVSHDGVIYNGRKPVIEYAGLKATENHNVWTEFGWKSLADCKKAGTPVAVGGIGWRPVRESGGYYRGDDNSGEPASLRSQVCRLRTDFHSPILPMEAGKFGVQSLRMQAAQSEWCIASDNSGYRGAHILRETSGSYCGSDSSREFKACRGRSAVHRLREAVRKIFVRIAERTGWLQKLCEVEWNTYVASLPVPSGPSEVHEPIIGGLSRLWWQGYRNEVRNFSRDGSLDYGALGPGPIAYVGSHRQQRPLRTGQSSVCDQYKTGEQSTNATEEVYDILNAGPRNRFTANGLIVSNCREGYNNKSVSAIAIFRPTKSRSLAEQMKGRGCRPLSGVVDGLETPGERRKAIAASDKPNCMIIDLVGITGLPPVATTAHLIATGKPDEVVELANDMALEMDGPVDMVELIKQAEQKIERQRREAEKREEERQQALAEKQEAERRARLEASVRYSQQQVAIGGDGPSAVVKDYVPSGPNGASEGQVKFLVRLGIEPEKAVGFSKRQAGIVIDKLKKKTGSDFIMRFGKHSGKPLKDVPGGYLDWAMKNTDSVELKQNIQLMRNPKPMPEEVPF